MTTKPSPSTVCQACEDAAKICSNLHTEYFHSGEFLKATATLICAAAIRSSCRHRSGSGGELMEAVNDAASFFEQQNKNDDPSYWEFSRTTRHLIAGKLREAALALTAGREDGAAGVPWEVLALAKLGYVRDGMTAEEVLIVQTFIGPIPAARSRGGKGE